MHSTPSPNPNLLGDLFWGIFRPQFIRMALMLDIFSPLASGPANAESVAQACNCHPSGIMALLEYFCTLHILERYGREYCLSPNAEVFLIQGCKAYADDMILHYTRQDL